jgi:putative acetyltransferase
VAAENILAAWNETMIRLYHPPHDTEAVLQVWYDAARFAYTFVPEDFWASEREDIRSKYLPLAQTWVYEQKGAIVGFLSLLDNHIGGLFVAPEQQGEGIGTKLIGHARTLHATLSLDVFEQNAPALRFYERRGFVVVGNSVHEATQCVNLKMSSEQNEIETLPNLGI